MKTTILLNLVVLSLTAALASAATRLVPGEYTTIQAAIDASVDGDVVIIAPDIYTGEGNRDIDFKGKAITVRSTDPNDPNIVAATIINCNGTEAEPHRGFYFHNSEGADSVVAGLTITNGYGPDEQVDQYIFSVGGAIFCDHSNPTITRCKIEGNEAENRGGGMYNYDSSPTVTNCTFSNNWTNSGGGMYNYGGNPTVTNTAFVDNGADHSAGGMYNAKESNSMVTNCTFSENSAGYYGGAMYNRDDSNTIVTNCTFSNNSARFNGGGVYNYASSPTISNCTFSKNSAGEEGGGINNCSHHNGPAIYPTVVNCTFSGNFALMDGGGIYDRRQSNTILINCILWGNSDSSGMDESAQIHKSDYGVPVVNYCCVQGWTGILGGMGNISADPTFVYPATDNYHLLPGSPCINAGDPDYIYVPEETDIDGDPRVMDGRIDMGVDEFILAPEPIIGISPTEFEIYADVGGANPENQILTVHNMGGGGTLYWMVTEDCPWLDIHPDSGESTGEIDEVTLSVNISGMNSGLYNCELTINTDGVVNSPQIVPVTLHIFDNDGELHVPSEYGTIQAAIDAAVDGQAVILDPGTYTGYGNRDLNFGGKAIAVRSTNPNDPVVVAATVIDCQGTEAEPHRGFRFHSGEGADSIIAGLTITNGYGQKEAVGYMASAGGAIFCFVSNPTITLCRIAGNHAGYMGGGIYCKESNPMIANCTFSRNWANYGGGICNKDGSPTVFNCTFSGNSVPGSGGAIFNYINANPIIANCTVSGNTARLGGGIHNDHSNSTLTNCTFIGNSAEYGGGMNNSWNSRPVITNCTFSGNSAVERGGGIQSSTGAHPTLKNCIVWGNEVETALEIWGSATVSYSNVQGGWPGEGNIDANPCFVDPVGGDYHLLAESPCIDSGDLAYIPSLGETDIDGEPRVMGGRVDMGADEFTSTLTPILRISPIELRFSTYVDGPNPDAQTLFIQNIGAGILNWEIFEDCPWLQIYPANGVSIGQVNEVTLSVNISGLAPDSYNCQLTINAEGTVNSPQVVLVTLSLGGSELYVPLEYDTIQAAIDAAIRWDTVIVAKGTYTGPGNRDIDFGGKAITVRSIDPNDPNTVAVTIIDCNGTEDEPHRGFYFHSGEDCNSVVAGFTITNGYASSGGGVYSNRCSPMLTNCIFRGNSADYGGGMGNWNSSPTLTNCTFSGNSVRWWGGGVYNGYYSSPVLNNCTFKENLSAYGGGAMFNVVCSPTLTNCTFRWNSAVSKGGGMVNASSSSILTNCTFSKNSAENGGGMYNYMDRGPAGFDQSNPTLTNCIFSMNFASEDGGGMYNYNGSSPTLTNCIFWGDTPEEIYVSDGTTVVTYCDVEGGWPGEGNIDADPLFVDANKGDYHLLADSPCIDAGDPNYIAEPNETDLDGKPRIIGGRIDMGAYEYSPPILAEVRIVPPTINLASKGKWITASLWLGEDYNVADIDANSVLLENEIEAESFRVDEQQQVAIVRFSRSEVQGILAPGEVELTVSGELTDGTRFEGADMIRVIDKSGKK